VDPKDPDKVDKGAVAAVVAGWRKECQVCTAELEYSLQEFVADWAISNVLWVWILALFLFDLTVERQWQRQWRKKLLFCAIKQIPDVGQLYFV
jgi:hypothetical protein